LNRGHQDNYDKAATYRCERTLITLLGDVGPWRERIYLAGGLAPSYIVGTLPAGVRPHVGTTDVDLVIGIAVGDAAETYRTLETNLKKANFRTGSSSFQWVRVVDGITVAVEFLCETAAVPPGRIFKPKDENTGSRLGAFNVRGAQLLTRDYLEREIEGERLDGGGRSLVTLRVANILPYAVLKIFAFQDRHENKDAYDLVFCLINYGDGPQDAGHAAAKSGVANEPVVTEALDLLGQRFVDVSQDGPSSYAAFLAEPGDDDQAARLRQEAVVVVREFLSSYHALLAADSDTWAT
jgi:hypothetical protein